MRAARQETSITVRLASVAQAVADASHAEEGLHAAVQAASHIFDAQTVAVVLLDEGGEGSHIKLARGLSAGFISGFSRPLSCGILAEVVYAGTPLCISEANRRDEVYREAKLEHDFGSLIAVALTVNRRPLGYFHVDTKGVGRLTGQDVVTVRCLGHLAALAVEKGRLQDAVTRLTPEDSLTGLATYTCFHQRLSTEIERVVRYGESLGVLAVEVTNAAWAEDVHGRAGVRELLRHAARTIQGNVRGVDFCARFRANTFLVCLVKADEPAVRSIAGRIIAALDSRPATCPAAEGHEEARMPVEVCIGAALAPAHGRDAQAIVSEVDKALIAARRAGAGHVAVAGD